MEKKGFVSKVLFTLICMFITAGVVYGAVGDGGGNASAGSATNVTGIGSWDNNSGYWTVGIRISFYTSNGTQIGSHDYMLPEAGTTRSTVYTQYGSGTPCAKIAYSSGACRYDHNKWQSWGNYSSINELNYIFNNNGISGIDIASLVRNSKITKYDLFSSVLNSDDTITAEQLFIRLGVNPLEYYDYVAKAFDLFIVWEPLGRILTSNAEYIGTPFELSNFVVGTKGIDSGDWANVATVVSKHLGCSVYLEGDATFADAVSAKFPSTFSPISYFRLIDVSVSSKVISGCKKPDGRAARLALQDYALASPSPLGMGVLWYNDLVSTPTVGCTDVNNYYGGKEVIINSIEKTGKFDFSKFNNYVYNNGLTLPNTASTGITASWYQTYCPWSQPTPGGINCTPQYNVSGCNIGTGGISYADAAKDLGTTEEYWNKCVFTDVNNGLANTYDIIPHKTSSTGNLSYRDTNLGGKYCEVYCIEDVTASFDKNNPTVLAGSHFVWGWSSVSSIRTCKTKSIDSNTFQKDLNAANIEVVRQLAQQKLYEANAGGSWIEGDKQYNPGTTQSSNFTCKMILATSDISDCSAKVSERISQGYSCTNNGLTGSDGITATYSYSCTKGSGPTYRCTNYTYQRAGGTKTSATVTEGGITQTATVDSGVFTRCVTSKPSGNPVTAGNVSAAVNVVNATINEYEKCFSFASNDLLKVDPQATISYYAPNTYSYVGEAMNKSTSNFLYQQSACGTKSNVVALKNCSGTSCNVKTYSMPTCLSHEAKKGDTTRFTLQSGVYNYILKNPNGLTLYSIHEKDLAGYKSGTLYVNWIDVGYSNFPVPYSAAFKKYEGNLVINYSKLGHVMSGTTAVDKILDEVDNKIYGYDVYGNWKCDYTVVPELIDNGDVNLIYREIDLSRPFPDTDASNRNTGSNWCSGDNCSWNNPLVESVILKNRKVTGKDVYNLEPMYTFIMTPSDIIKIRKYNDVNTYTSYNGSYSGNTYDFKCIEGTGSGCRSTYLTELMNMLDTANEPGTCKLDRQVYNSQAKFDACRY